MRRQHEKPENHERWLVSYADFITLLFAFFVVMYAISQVNEGKYRVLSNSLVTAFGKPAGPEAPAGGAAGAARYVELPPYPAATRRERERLDRIGQDLLEALDSLAATGEARVTRSPRGLQVEIAASALFRTGEATLGGEAAASLARVARVLRAHPNAIEVEGHTDAIPIATSRFASNWELSAGRASAVVRLLAGEGVAETRLSATGYGATRPVADNASDAGRARNRRVNLLIRNQSPAPAVTPTLGTAAPVTE